MAGRFAPTPTSDLHLGNLRTALVAALAARSAAMPFLIRIEDLDQARVRAAGDIAERQLADLARLGLTSDVAVVRQSERSAIYDAALERIRDHTYECFCSRKEIAAVTQAPHGVTLPYPGTCRELTEAQRAERRLTRPAAIRLRAGGATEQVTDLLHGSVEGVVDDIVLRRGDGVHAYHLAVVVDDGLQEVTEVVRGDDLLSSAPAQSYLARLLGFAPPLYAHIPLVTGPGGQRLAKRDGAIGVAALASRGLGPGEILAHLGASLGEAISTRNAAESALLGDGGTALWKVRPSSPDQMKDSAITDSAVGDVQAHTTDPGAVVARWADGFDITRLPRQPWIVETDQAPVASRTSTT
jgi:glutamyl-tRNA synthetase